MATNSLKLDPVSSFKIKGMMEGGKTDSPTSEALLKKERRFPPASEATLSMGTVKLFIGGLFLAFVLGALVTGTAMHLASGSFNQYLGARRTEFASGSCVWTASGYHCSALPSDLPTDSTHGRHLAATCNQFNVAVSGTTFKGTQKMGDSTVGIWEATVTNQCASSPLTSLTVSTDGRYNPAGGANPRGQTGLANCSPPTVDKNGVLHGPVTCAVVLPAGGLGAGQSMTIQYVDNNAVAGPAAHTFAVGAAAYAAAAPVAGGSPAPAPGAACNQFNVAVSPTTFQSSTKMGDSTVGVWQATITNKCAGLPLTSAVVSTDGRYNPAGGIDPRAQTGLQNCSPPTVDKNGVLHGPVTCHVALPGGSLGAGQSFTFTYVDNNLAGASPAHTFAVSAATYGTAAAQTPAAVNCNQFNVAVAPTAFTGVSKIGGGQVGNWQATITNQCAAGKLTSLTVTTSGRFNPAGGIPRSTTNLANCTPPTVDKQGTLHGPVTCQVVLPGGTLGAGQSMTVTYTDNNLGGAAAYNFATGAATYAAA